MKVVQTENSSFVRDLHSKALINTDRVALENHRKKRKLEVQQAEKLQQMEIKLKELVSVKDEMLEINKIFLDLSFDLYLSPQINQYLFLTLITFCFFLGLELKA